MGKELEIEFKNLLTKKEFAKLCQIFGIKEDQFFSQTNFYFDTPHFHLKSAKCALRIREKNNNYTLTLKEPHTEGNLETNQTIGKEDAIRIINGGPLVQGEVFAALESQKVQPNLLQHLGSMKTTRAERNYADCLLVLDHSSYLETEDFELELEAPSRIIGENVFRSILKENDIPYRKTEPKIKRFFDEKWRGNKRKNKTGGDTND